MYQGICFNTISCQHFILKMVNQMYLNIKVKFKYNQSILILTSPKFARLYEFSIPSFFKKKNEVPPSQGGSLTFIN